MNDKGGYTMKYLLKNGTVVSGDKSEKLDVLVDGEKIVNVGKDLEAGDAEVIDVEESFCFRDLSTVIHILTWKWQGLSQQMT